MERSAESSREVPGWVILTPEAVPDAWRSRAVPMVLVPLTPAESGQLLSDVPVEQGVAATDMQLIRTPKR
jgi:hypothetical protein